MILYLAFSLSVGVIPMVRTCHTVLFNDSSEVGIQIVLWRKHSPEGVHHCVNLTEQVLKIKCVLYSVNIQRYSFFTLLWSLSAACIYLVCYEWRANGTGFCSVQASSCYLSSGPGAGLPGFWNAFLDWGTTDMTPKMASSVTFPR